MAKAIHTRDAIIAAGQKLEIDNPGSNIEPWEIYKSLGSVGKFARLEDIWKAHQASLERQPSVEREELPSDIDENLNVGLETLGTTVRQLFATYAAGLMADHVRQMQLAQKHHMDDVTKLRSQVEFWMETAFEAKEELAAAPCPQNPKASTKARSSQTARMKSTKTRRAASQKSDAKLSPETQTCTVLTPRKKLI